MAITNQQLERTMRRVFGVDQFRPGQSEVVRAVLDGRDTVAVMPTGSGKSLCYQLPGLHLRGTTVVVSPLISLMKDQTDKLASMGIDAAQVNSALASHEAQTSMERIRTQQSEFVLATPERLTDPGFIASLEHHHIDFVVVDEAHCVSQWGHDFRPAFLDITTALEALGRPPVLALTATATASVLDDIVASLGLRNPAVINTGIYRPNLAFSVLRTANDLEKRLRLLDLLRTTEGSGIVYVSSVKEAVTVHGELRIAGIAAGLYHGRLAAGARRAVQDEFMRGDLPVMVATNAFGMGIDKPDIRFVVHYNVPGSLEAYYQEAGRAGRDGAEAAVVLLFRLEDRRIHRYFIGSRYRGVETRLRRKGLPADEAERQRREHEARREKDEAKLERMMLYGQSAGCRWRTLLDYFGEEGTDPDFRCGTCDNCRMPLEAQIAAPGAA